jgi:hypothetical protein
MPVMNSNSANSRFLLLPEQGEQSVSAQQPVVRRYSLARLPSVRAEPLPKERGRD